MLEKIISYTIAFFFTVGVYWKFVLPIEMSELIQNQTLLQLIIFITLAIFPLLMAWTVNTRGVKSLLISLPFYLSGLLLLYRGFYLSDQYSILDTLFAKIVSTHSEGDWVAATFLGLESFLFYIIVAELGVIISLIVFKQEKKVVAKGL
ncbi:hypothetical protein DS745_06795 [Anaerobacillus alkaliphilus]|uniref:Uncharacterized protein n=1 Tax=Anaerobacillus alkaliphilus TaxID=1548597 RepID=A0A4Q0VUJ6_9BACI|nr:hypothetical protein [Anaerobacillus alkaliphilus]RXJ02406.1 hypothetical protein DS745_06795 [Anaerobacillus alkaliphilus]